MITEFDTFRVKKGREERAKEWMKTITERQAECIDTSYELDKFRHVVTFAPDIVSKSLEAAANA